MTRLEGPGTGGGGKPDPNIHVFDVNGDGVGDVRGVAPPGSPTYTFLTPLNADGVPVVNSITNPTTNQINPVYPGWVPNPGNQIQIYEPEEPGGNTIITPPINPSTIQTTTAPPGDSNSEDSGGTTGTGTETSETTGLGSTDDPTAGGGDGYFGYDPDFAY